LKFTICVENSSMKPRGPGPGIDHRLRVVLPEPVGDRDLRIHSYGVRELVAPTLIDRPGGTDSWLLIAFHSPAQIWLEGQGLQSAPAGSLVVWRAHAPHRYGNPTGSWLHSWMHCDGDLLRVAFDGGALPLERPILGIPTRLTDRLVLQLHTELSEQVRADPAILHLHLQVWLRSVTRVLAGDAAVAPGLRAARVAIESRYAEALDLAGLAAIAGCSRQHLCSAFHAAFGSTPIQHLIRVRLRQAHLLLQDPAITVAEAAAQAGFPDYRHFSRLYRRHVGHAARQPATVCASRVAAPPSGGGRRVRTRRGR
jgi:AraC family transcriptional regulator, arabinose operon regulatory protein